MAISTCVPENGRSGPSRSASKPGRQGNRFAKKLAAFSWRITVLLATVSFAGCSSHRFGAHESHSLTPAGEAAVREGVQAFMQRVADDVTRDGPLAWCKYLDRSPAFFMVVNGQMAFPNGEAAQEGTQKFAQTMSHIELKWGNDLRVDPLTAELAVVAVSWSEVQLDTKGHRVAEAGYFTGLAAYREEHWELRDAHWSSPVPTRPATNQEPVNSRRKTNLILRRHRDARAMICRSSLALKAAMHLPAKMEDLDRNLREHAALPQTLRTEKQNTDKLWRFGLGPQAS